VKSAVAAGVLTYLVFAHPVEAQHRRPTPRETIERNLMPIATTVRALQLTDSEREHTADVLERAEIAAAEIVEAERRGDHAAVRARTRRIDLLSRLLRARVEALRLEATAAERERAVLQAEDRRTQARASLERAAEQRTALERTDGVSAFTLPPAEPDAGTSPSAGTP
jgi:hypothetical protein